MGGAEFGALQGLGMWVTKSAPGGRREGEGEEGCAFYRLGLLAG